VLIFLLIQTLHQKIAIGILFKEQESGFLAGVLAGLLTKNIQILVRN